MIHINNDLTHEEQAALFQAMTVEQLKTLKGTPVKMNWSDEDLEDMAAHQSDEDSPYISLFQRMSTTEIGNFTLFKKMSMSEKTTITGLSEITIETIEKDATLAVYGDILRYCNRLGIPKELFLESIYEEELV
jgi:hypothetical protein